MPIAAAEDLASMQQHHRLVAVVARGSGGRQRLVGNGHCRGGVVPRRHQGEPVEAADERCRRRRTALLEHRAGLLIESARLVTVTAPVQRPLGELR